MSKGFLEKFTVLRSAPRELWVTYLLKVLEIFAYGLMQSTIVLWLSSDLGFSDANAGYTIALWSSLISFLTVLVGSFTDAVGIRRAFIMGFAVVLTSRAVMGLVGVQWIALAFGLMPLALGLALMVPVMTAAIRRFSSTPQRSIAFSLFYVAMNLGFTFSGWVFDLVRQRLGEYGTIGIPLIGTQVSTYRFLFILAFLFSIPGMLVSLFAVREGVEATDEGIEIHRQEPKYPGHNVITTLWLMAKDTAKKTVSIFLDVWKQPTFYRFLAFLTLIVGVKLIFYHMHYTFPKYAIRELGQGAPFGQLYGVLNPVLILILVPIVGALTQRISAYRMITVGSFISAASLFFLVIPPELFTSLANGWFGNLIAHTWLGVPGETVNPLYVSIAIFVVFFSIGEAVWSPRVYEYTAAIAPKGQEASYMALSILPFFVAKFVVGMLSGILLQAYCPAEGPRNSGVMWLWIAGMALLTPVGAVVFRNYIRVKEAGRED